MSDKAKFTREDRKLAEALSAEVGVLILDQTEFKGIRSIEGKTVPEKDGGVRLTATANGRDGEKLGTLDTVMKVKAGVRFRDASAFDADGNLLRKESCEKKGDMNSCTVTGPDGKVMSKSITMGRVQVEKDADGHLLSTSERTKQQLNYLSLVTPFMAPRGSLEYRKMDANGKILENTAGTVYVEKLIPFMQYTKTTLEARKQIEADGSSRTVHGVSYGNKEEVTFKAELKK